jgi:hypothetical protein
MTTTLHPATESSDGRCSTTNHNDIVGLRHGVDVGEGVAAANVDRRSSPVRCFAGRLELWLESHSCPKVVDPDLKAPVPIRSSEYVVASVLDHKTDVVLLCKVDTSLDVAWEGSIDSVHRIIA